MGFVSATDIVTIKLSTDGGGNEGDDAEEGGEDEDDDEEEESSGEDDAEEEAAHAGGAGAGGAGEGGAGEGGIEKVVVLWQQMRKVKERIMARKVRESGRGTRRRGPRPKGSRREEWWIRS